MCDAYDAPDLYAVLQVAPGAEPDVIRAAYQCLVRKYHPDRNPGDPAAHRLTVLLNEAKDILLDPVRRARYDRDRPPPAGERLRREVEELRRRLEAERRLRAEELRLEQERHRQIREYLQRQVQELRGLLECERLRAEDATLFDFRDPGDGADGVPGEEQGGWGPEFAGNVVPAGDGGWQPAPGYAWVSGRPGDYRVSWSPGKRHSRYANVVASATEKRFHPAPGYVWAGRSAGDFRVRWCPGKGHRRHPGVVASAEEAVWEPAPGYEFVNDRDDDLRVAPVGRNGRGT